MAEVFLARQWGPSGFFRDVVIKRLFSHYAEHETALRMFQDEARLLAELGHPNIPQVYDLDYEDGAWFLAMEHVTGVSLAELCLVAAKAKQPLPHPVAIGIISQVSMALHHAHERRDREGRALRIVHRDVTPQNIMVSLDAVVKVLDFGVAQTTARIETDAGAVRGTYAYMAPEQVRGRPLDKRVDVFALGINLYELTTGRRLFRGNDIEIMTAVVEREIPRPSTLVDNYPQELEEIVMGALQRDRSARTPSAAHLAHQLDQFCMRNGFGTGPMVVSQFVRSVFPYERAHEAGMGIAQHDDEILGQEAPLRAGIHEPLPATAAASASHEEVERRLLEEELRELERDAVSDVLELGADELVIDEEDTAVLAEISEPAPSASAHLGLDAFDEDSDVKPVVLLSPKSKPSPTEEGAFLGELERRLSEESGSSHE